MAPLGEGARNAIRAVLSRKYGRHEVKEDIIGILVEYFGGRGEEVRSIPLDVDVRWKMRAVQNGVQLRRGGPART